MLAEQSKKMCRLKQHYGIKGETGWRPWYQLALAIASELDDGLKIIDPLPKGKTAAKWRGAWGIVLLKEVAAMKEGHPSWSARSCLHQMQKWGAYSAMSLAALCVRHSEAKRYHASITKPPPKKKRVS